MKLKIIAFFLLISLASSVVGQSHNFEIGDTTDDDVLLYSQVVLKASSLLQIVTRDVTFPGPEEENNVTISYIKAYDQYVNGDGGYCTLTDGGLGFSHVSLNFRSQRGNGLYFLLEVWGL